MNPRFFPLLLAVLIPLAAVAKPPPTSRPSPSPPVALDADSPSILPFLLLQNGGPTATTAPWPELVRAAGGKQVTPVDPAKAPDAAVLAKLGAALDALLPRLNRPDTPLHTALTTAELNARVADELRTALAAENLAPGASCPVLRWNEPAGGRTVYLLVAAYPAGGKEPAFRALTVRAADLAGQITADGACLLVGIEHNGKTGHDLALLNWEIIDLSRVSLRCAVTFEGDADALHVPGAVLGDGRRGRD